MPKEIDIFISFLKKRNLRLTDQRQVILRVFLKVNKHLSVEDLYRIVKKKDPHIGQATIFRTLKLLCVAGIANEVDLGDKRIRYEHKYGHQHHDHLVCLKCGRFIEVFDSNIEKLQKKLCRKFGFLPQKYKMEIFGICKKCQSKNRDRK